MKGALLWDDFEALKAHACPKAFDRLGIRRLLWAGVGAEPPGFDEGADRNIEGAPSFFADSLRGGHDFKCGGRNREGSQAGLSVKSRNFRVDLPIRHQGDHFRQSRFGGPGGLANFLWAKPRPGQLDFPGGPHGLAPEGHIGARRLGPPHPMDG